MGLWKFVEIIGYMLDRAERDAVLGDIYERGVNIQALLDLLSLIALRQLQAWKSWRIWLLMVSMGIPALAVVGGAQVIADTASYYPWPDLSETRRAYFLGLILCRIVAILGLAWATGFSIASFARYRAISILIPVAFITIWQPVSLTALALLVGIPGLLGLARGWRGDRLRPKAVVILAVLCLPAFLVANATTWNARIYTLGAFWPAYYAAASVFMSAGRSNPVVTRAD